MEHLNTLLLATLNIIAGMICYAFFDFKAQVKEGFVKAANDLSALQNKVDHHIADYSLHGMKVAAIVALLFLLQGCAAPRPLIAYDDCGGNHAPHAIIEVSPVGGAA